MKRFVSIVALMSAMMLAYAAPNEKFFKKAAEYVWAQQVYGFDAKTQIPDSISKDQSAVIIAAYDGVNVDLIERASVTKQMSVGNGTTNRADANFTTRIMVKLLDATAVEYYTDFSFGEQYRATANSFRYSSLDNAFGARIHKPDGTVRDVDVSDAYSITAGKNGKAEVNRKIAIPGLEIGDVLEYFYYTEQWVDELDLPEREFSFCRKYPMMAYTIDCRIHPNLTIEVKPMNGAPQLSRSKDGIFNKLNVTAINMPGRPNAPYINDARQLPYIRMNILNNTSTMRFIPSSARRGGIYNPNEKAYLDDITCLLSYLKNYESSIPGRAAKTAREYFKQHPDATLRQKTDAAWVALIYHAQIDPKNKYDDLELVIMFQDMCEKLDLSDSSAAISFITSRAKVPTANILSWRDPDFAVSINNEFYLPAGTVYTVPGEWPVNYQGEDGRRIDGHRKNYSNGYKADRFSVPITKPTRNSIVSKIDVAIDSDDPEMLSIKRDITAIGGNKAAICKKINDSHIWITEAERFLGIPEKNRYKEKNYDELAYVEKLIEVFTDENKAMLCTNPTQLDSFVVMSHGIMPDKPALHYSVDCKVAELITNTDSEMIINIGKLVGNHTALTGNQRERQMDAYFGCPSNIIHSITLQAPEGYEFNTASVEKLNTNTTTSSGCYITQAEINNDGNLTLRINERNNTYILPVEHWSSFLKVSDAKAAMTDAVVILNRI